MEIRLFKNWWLLGLKGLVFFLLGIFTLFNSNTAAETLILVFGISGLLAGLSEIAVSLSNRDQENWGALLGEGVLDLLIGLIFLIKPGVANILPVLVGIWVLFAGISLLSRSLRGGREPVLEESGGSWLGIILIIVGFFLVTNPFGAYQTLMVFLGIALVLLGLVVMFIAWKLRGVGKRIGQAVETLTSRFKDR